ncbi:hypothetical protein M409DRAFT_62904 [Zasmidium cellare ATCC 36951]|uniref:Uncharacterized protein n=1 Tax=Zasmidium cellare ATCC 36951 TaxID=1080233 RepID=A0A6A6CZC2_ZASCE|nr:uncharacterized protein M409DRAFT_62904 [Zasmidium cellare ATCC 36951]KAF2172093.1 hypothetical protein M409DRAFT_62904 [Zasmidium cellare ATCC 36951]
MSSSKSWFASVSSSKGRLLSNSSHELPRWRTPSPMAASMIPPPIVQSMHQSTANPATESVIIEKLSPFEDRQHELEADLQFLLDAQVEGLTRGLDGGSLDDRSSTGSTTPTVQSMRSESARRQRKPIRRQPGLRSARKGIYNSIIALSALKDDELRDIDDQIEEHEGTLEQIESWEQKRNGLKEASAKVDSSEQTVRIQRLRQEADGLQADINQVELQLMEMKSRHRKILGQAADAENSIQAKLASYTNSLRLLEEDVQKFLSVKPTGTDARPSSQDGKQSMWELPSKRRNLDMAKEYWNQQREMSANERQQHEQEKMAYVEGAAMWKEAVTEVNGFERQLRTEMAALRPSSPNSQSAWEDQADPEEGSSDGLKGLLNQIDVVIGSLEKKHETAEERGWKLLIAAIGAELDALKRGKQILSNVLGVTAEADQAETNGQDLTARPIGSAPSVQEDEHDGPDEDLLFSKHTDTDTD